MIGAAGAKANVLHCVGFERWDAALLILQKRWHYVCHFLFIHCRSCRLLG